MLLIGQIEKNFFNISIWSNFSDDQQHLWKTIIGKTFPCGFVSTAILNWFFPLMGLSFSQQSNLIAWRNFEGKGWPSKESFRKFSSGQNINIELGVKRFRPEE